MDAASPEVDLNADVGEGAGQDESLIPLVTSANIACGGHAGTAGSMARAVAIAIDSGAAIGAHPGFEDRANFGRLEQAIEPPEARDLVRRQFDALSREARRQGAKIGHVKLHGALYHLAARDEDIASAIADAVLELDPGLILFGPPGSELLAAAQSRGLAVANEVFADRRYRRDGSLVPRDQPGALIESPEDSIAQVLGMVRDGRVRADDGTEIAVRADTVCLHGDTPKAVALARALRAALIGQGVRICGPRGKEKGSG